MNVSAQALMGFFLVLALFAVSVDADEQSFIVFDDPLGQVEVGVPSLGVELDHAEREIAAKLTGEIRFTSKEGPAAVLVSTRIRPDLPKDDRVLERVEPKY